MPGFELSSVHHDGSPRYVRLPANAQPGARAQIRLRTAPPGVAVSDGAVPRQGDHAPAVAAPGVAVSDGAVPRQGDHGDAVAAPGVAVSDGAVPRRDDHDAAVAAPGVAVSDGAVPQRSDYGDGVADSDGAAVPGAVIERIFLRYCPDGEQRFLELLPDPTPANPALRWWQVDLPIEMPIIHYRFLLLTSQGPWWYNGSGLHAGLVSDAEDFRILAGYAAPEWVRSSVFYQIFPDRFADGDPTNNVQPGEIQVWGHSSSQGRWGEPPTAGRQAMVEFFGGDLQGIEQRLDYLQELGIDALYLTPIFPANSSHHYDLTDYLRVDPHLGGDDALISLRAALSRRGMRLVLDTVPNHCGFFHPWFQAALADPSAPTAEFFTFHQHPGQYASWLGVPSLPKLNYRSPALREIMYAGRQAVLRYWLRPPFSIDGWRLDVANMLGRQGEVQVAREVSEGIRQAVKEENPQAYLLAENFFDASQQLQGDQWDASMNYSGFSKPLWYWLSGFYLRQHGQPDKIASTAPWSTQALVDSWQSFRAAIPWSIAQQQYNLLGSHDTERILAVLKNDQALNRLAVGLLFTYPGVPSVYYGDEVGLSGDQRACMPWDASAWDTGLRDFYKQMIALRRTSPALIEGGFQVLEVRENGLAFLRDAEDEQIIVVCQRRPGVRPPGPLPVAAGGIPDGSAWQELFSARQAVVQAGSLPLPEVEPGIQIWRSRELQLLRRS